jgi:acyl carrier protein
MIGMSNREIVREYLTRLLEEKDDTAPFADNDSLVLSGRLDSLNVVDVLTFLEGQFAVSVDADEFDQTDFDTMESILRLCQRSAPSQRDCIAEHAVR